MRGATHLGVALALVLAFAALGGCGHYGAPRRAFEPTSPTNADEAQPTSDDPAECEDPAASAETQP